MARLIDADALLLAYDAAHKGPPGGARKLIEEALTIAAIPVEWLRNICTIPEMETEDKICIDWLIQMWQQEQEAR